MKIKTVLTLTLSWFAVSAIIAFLVVGSIILGEQTETEYIKRVESAAEAQSRNVGLYISSLEADFAALLKSAEAFPAANRENYIAEYAENSPAITRVYVNGVTRSETEDSFSLEQIADLEDGKVYGVSFKGTPTTDYALAIKGNIGGVEVVALYSPATVGTIIESAKLNANGRLVLIDSADRVIDGAEFLGDISQLPSRTRKPAEYAEIIRMEAAGADSRVYRAGKPTVTSVIRPTESGWRVIVSGEVSAVRSEASDALNGLTFAVIALCAAGLVATGFIARRFTRPLDIITRTVMQIRRGDHDARINVMANNEYGEVSRQFNDLIDDIVVGEMRYRTIIDMSDNIVFEWNRVNNNIIFSNAFNRKFSYRAPSDHFGDCFLLKCKVHPDDADDFRADLERLGKGEDLKGSEYRIQNIYKDYMWFVIRTASLCDSDNRVVKTVGIIVDIDRAKRTEASLIDRASYDSLTGVYNRESIENLIDNEIDMLATRQEPFAVLFVDIDNFKDFNDDYSHATGDLVLTFAAQVLSRIISDYGMVGRHGGDEFVLLLKNCNAVDPEQIAKDILARFGEGFDADTGDHITLSASIGIVVVSDATRRIDAVMTAADDAMYKVKKSGKSGYAFLDK